MVCGFAGDGRADILWNHLQVPRGSHHDGHFHEWPHLGRPHFHASRQVNASACQYPSMKHFRQRTPFRTVLRAHVRYIAVHLHLDSIWVVTSVPTGRCGPASVSALDVALPMAVHLGVLAARCIGCGRPCLVQTLYFILPLICGHSIFLFLRITTGRVRRHRRG